MKRSQQVMISAVATLMMAGVMQVQGKFLVEKGFHIVAFELAKTPQRVQQIIGAWHTEGVAAAQWNTYIDFIFIAAYVSFGFFSTLALTENDENPLIRKAGTIMSKGMIAAGIFDISENLCMLRALYGNIQDNVIFFTYWLAWVKFALIGIVAISTGVLLIKKLVDRLVKY